MFKFLLKLFGISPKPKQEKKVTPQLEYMQWPVSNVTLAHPVGMPRDVALLGLCDMPTDTPVANQYKDDGTKIPDPVGICLSMIKFQLWSGKEKLAEEAALPHDGKVRCIFGSNDLSALFKRMDSKTVPIHVVAYPRFYELDEKGHGHLLGDDRGYHKGEECHSSVYQLSFNQERKILIDGEAEPENVDPGPTAEEAAAMAEHDRIMREEREKRLAKERELKERVARENREHNEKIEREKKEHEQEQRRIKADEKARRKQEKIEAKREKERAAKERKKLGIKDPSDVSKALKNPPSEDGNYMALVNLWEAQYAPHDLDGFRKRLVDIKQNAEFEGAVDEIFKRIGE